MTLSVSTSSPLLAEVRQMIDAARHRVGAAVNTELTPLCWHIGRRISVKLHQSIELARFKLLRNADQ